MNEDQPQTINVAIIDYIDRENKIIDQTIESRCKEWGLSLGALRKEWELEHKNLVQRYESSEDAKALAKIEVDRHFETINSLQARMDKLSATFVSKEEFNRDMDNKLKTIWGAIVTISSLIVASFIAHIFGKL